MHRTTVIHTRDLKKAFIVILNIRSTQTKRNGRFVPIRSLTRVNAKGYKNFLDFEPPLTANR